MYYYVREIALSKWPKKNDDDTDAFDIMNLWADAIADIRTSENKLSVYRVLSLNDEDIDEAVLALTTSLKLQGIQKMDFVVFSDEDVKGCGLIMENKAGETAANDLKNTHCNIINLTYGSLTGIAEVISGMTISGNQIRRTKSQVKALIKKISAGLMLIPFFMKK